MFIEEELDRYIYWIEERERIRTKKEEEGLDVYEHGESAYN